MKTMTVSVLTSSCCGRAVSAPQDQSSSRSVRRRDRGRWSVWVNGNWRMTFEFKDGHAFVLDYEDYH
jgi:plasmid maintenance system killer protein